MKKNKDRVIDCTSNNFDGMIAVMSPEDSWVCKWQRISKQFNYISHMLIDINLFIHLDRFCKGVYAISVSGRLPNSIIRDMKNRGINYRSRDTSQR
jgi:transcription elongation factor SPT4